MESKKYFEKEEEFLKLLYEKEGKLYSKSRIFANVKITPELLIEKKFTLEYCDINKLDGLATDSDICTLNQSVLDNWFKSPAISKLVPSLIIR